MGVWHYIFFGAWAVGALLIASKDMTDLRKTTPLTFGAGLTMGLDSLIWPIRAVALVTFALAVAVFSFWKDFLNVLRVIIDGDITDVNKS